MQMKKTIFTFGVIGGLLASLMMIGTTPFLHKISSTTGLIVGYTSIVASFLLVYFGIRSYRDTVGGGQISFGRGFAVGICITLITCAFYVVTWEIIYFNFMPHIMDGYGAGAVEKLRASGASAAVVQAKVDAMRKFHDSYNNPLYNSMMTFIEPFPVGLVITLLSAAVLKRRVAGAAFEPTMQA
jgi:hypothetical protein